VRTPDVPQSPFTFPTIVTTLRAAGCVFAEDEARLLIAEAAHAAELARMVERRAAGSPLEHVLGWVDFCDRRIDVDAGVFVPRRRSELLVRQGAALARPGAVVVDLCCGSGALGVVLSGQVAAVELHAADIDPAAVRCARRNVEPIGGQVHEGDLFDALPPSLRGRIDVLVANVPYVPSHAIALMPPEAREHEPRGALDGGADGLDFQRAVAAESRRWLRRGGHVLMETGARQASASVDILTRAGFLARTVHSDDLDATIVVGTWVGTVRRPTCANGHADVM
jgi:release factor glutamine methyltransferase